MLRPAFVRHSERNWWLREGKNWVISNGWPSYRMDSIVGRVFLFIQFIRSYSLLFEEAISKILLSKNSLFAIWVFDLNFCQCLMSPVFRYLFRLSVHAWVHHSLECFVMCFFLAWEYHVSLKMFASCWTVISRFSLDMMFVVLRASMLSVIALIKFFFFCYLCIWTRRNYLC